MHRWQELMQSGKVSVNGHIMTDPSYIIKAGIKIVWYLAAFELLFCCAVCVMYSLSLN